MEIGKTVQNFHCLTEVLLILCALTNCSWGLEKAIQPQEDYALSLWLITRTGWIYCERAGVYMQVAQQRFNEIKCKKCYFDLFSAYKDEPENVTDKEILKCSRNFGASLIPTLPSLTTQKPKDNRWEQVQALGLFRQLNPLETMGVRAFTCNSEVSRARSITIDQLILPTVATMFQLFSTREFSQSNNPNRRFPRESYVDCLFGKLYETEMALCPITAARRRCALRNRAADEELIFSTNIPIGYETSI